MLRTSPEAGRRGSLRLPARGGSELLLLLLLLLPLLHPPAEEEDLGGVEAKGSVRRTNREASACIS